MQFSTNDLLQLTSHVCNSSSFCSEKEIVYLNNVISYFIMTYLITLSSYECKCWPYRLQERKLRQTIMDHNILYCLRLPRNTGVHHLIAIYNVSEVQFQS